MTPTLVVLATVLVGAIIVDAQLLQGQNDNKHESNVTGDRIPTSTITAEIQDHSRKEHRPQEQGETFTWEHYLESGEIVSERAFVPTNSSVIVVKSRDRDLRGQNITRSTFVYYFTDKNAIVAIIPWRLTGPCLIKNTSLTYKAALDLLTARNGTTIDSSTKESIDANIAPLTAEETNTFFESNPGLRRACGFRAIILTIESGENIKPFSNSTNDLTTMTLEADVTITVPAVPSSPDQAVVSNNGDRKNGFQRSLNPGSRWGLKFDGFTDKSSH